MSLILGRDETTGTRVRLTRARTSTLWFSKLERDSIERGIFTSTHDLKRKHLASITQHNTKAKPFLWTYNNPERGIRVSHQMTQATR